MTVLLPAREISTTNSPTNPCRSTRTFNRLAATQANIDQIIYQLCKAVGIRESQMRALLTAPVIKKEESPKKEKEVVVIGAGNSGVSPWQHVCCSFNPETAEWSDIQSLAADISEAKNKKPKGRKKEPLLAFIGAEREQLIADQAKEVPINVKKIIKLREQFPFLKQKDCPDVLKLLVNDMINAYEAYKEGRDKLWDTMTEEEEKILAREIVDNFIENKEAYDELEHFKANGTLLGAHPVFRETEIKADLDKLDGDELRKRYQALRTNVSRNETKAKEAEEAEKKAEFETRAEDYAWQRDYVQELLKKKK